MPKTYHIRTANSIGKDLPATGMKGNDAYRYNKCGKSSGTRPTPAVRGDLTDVGLDRDSSLYSLK